MKTKKLIALMFVIFVIATLSGCADVSPHQETCITSNPYGFWSGLWHGMILPISFIGSLLSDSIAVYGIDNNGNWYDFGFALGSGAVGRFIIAVFGRRNK